MTNHNVRLPAVACQADFEPGDIAPTAVLARPLTSFDLTVVGLDLTVGPATQQVPKGVTNTVTTHLDIPQVSIPIASLQKLLPQTLAARERAGGEAMRSGA